MTYRAHIIEDRGDPFLRPLRLFIRQSLGDWHHSWLDGSGVFHTLEEGAVPPDDVGIVIPREAIEAVAAAVEEWQGRSNHGATESRLLREWLAVEQRRVDALLALNR